jgi:hypothetical protein
MNEMIQIRSVKQYFNDFIVEELKGLKKVREVDLIPVKQKILDAFKKEIFGQIVFKLGDDAKNMSKDDLAKLDVVNNILVQSFRKWRRLCILCGEYGLGSFFQLEDLKNVLDSDDELEPDPNDIVEIPEDPGEDVTDQLDEEPIYLNGGLTVDD